MITGYRRTLVEVFMTELLKRITVDPEVCAGRPCIRGLRIRVADILNLLASGAPLEEILQDYPYVEREDISAVLEFAARQNPN